MNGMTPGFHEQLQDAVKELFAGVVPERAADLERYWNNFGPQFRILDDTGPDGPLVMDAGSYVFIRFNHRIMRLFWLASFALWEGYRAFHHYTLTTETNIAYFTELLDCFEATRTANNVDDVPWPSGVPQPGVLVDHTPGNPARVSGELATFAIGWAFLHELQHLINQQELTGAPLDNEQLCRAEEHACDEFATLFLLERIANWSSDNGGARSIVAAKRQTGIYCALFALTLLARDNWGGSKTHPAIQERINKVIEVVRAQGMSRMAAVIAVSAFSCLRLCHADAPNPMEAVSEVAIRESWTPVDDLF